MTTPYPLVTVGALVFNAKGEVLLVKTHKWHNKYGLPGGKIEVGESAENALIRELKEETNLNIYNIEFVLVQDCIFSEEFYKPKHFVFLNYSCYTNNPTEIILNDEAQEYLWTNPHLALRLDLNQQTKILIDKVIENQSVKTKV
jgi:ADP-ribose pyrophosphatase YjhB (NUDIX family)